AFPTLPTLPALPERVDLDAWLATLNQKMYLRHVDRNGCVDVDLQTYYISPQMVRQAVLLRVITQSCQFAVWQQDQVVKRPPIKELVGQEMALTTMCNTSCKKRWLLLDALLLVRPGKSD